MVAGYRSWQWIVCNEVGYIQDAAPEGEPSLISRIVNPAYDLRQCVNFFPDYFPETPVPNVNATNTAYKGWDVQEDRLFFANGISASRFACFNTGLLIGSSHHSQRTLGVRPPCPLRA